MSKNKTSEMSPTERFDAEHDFNRRLAAADAAVDNRVAHKAAQQRDNQLQLAAEIQAKHTGPDGNLPENYFRSWTQHVANAKAWDETVRMAEKVASEKRHEGKVLRVIERRTYEDGGRHSWFADLATTMQPRASLFGTAVMRHDEASARLRQHGKEVATEMRDGTPEGRYAMRCLREQYRTIDQGPRSARQITQEAERRALDTTSTSGGSFVTPIYLVEKWSKYRSPVAAFADSGRQCPLDPYGMEVYVPEFTSTTDVDPQSPENTGIDTASPSAGYLSSALSVFAGRIPMSQQLLDRGGDDRNGSHFDKEAFAQLNVQLDARFDLYALTAAIASAGTVTEGTALTTPLLYANLSTAREQMAAAGAYLRASHVFATTDVFDGWFMKQVDGEGRPIFLPESGSILTADPVGSPLLANDSTWLGTHLGVVPLYADDSIPAYTGEPTWAQIIYAHMPSVMVFRGDPIVQVMPVDTQAPTLSTSVQLRQYGCVIIRHAGYSVQVLSGAGYAELS